MNLVIVGFGVVGQGLVEILRDKAPVLEAQFGFRPRIVAVATRTRGTLFHPGGLKPDHLLAAISAGSLDHYPNEPGLVRGLPALTLIRESNANVLVEASITDLKTAQPALDYCHAALETEKHVVLANKGPVALAYNELQAKARENGRLLRFEATVMAGTPSIRLALDALAGCTIQEARGILNGTTNYMLTQMESGMTYADALAQAQALGYAEADPTADVDGWDGASKGMILAAMLFGKSLTLDSMEVRGISSLTPDDIEAARAAGERWKLIARVTPDGATVGPVRLPVDNPLANVSGSMNAITYTTDLLGDVTLVGAGAGRLQTGFGLLSDLLEIHAMARGISAH